MTASTGGEAYFAKSWKDQRDAFNSIREDLAHLYFMSYYPQPNPNRGWRTISVKITNPQYKKYRIRNAERFTAPFQLAVASTLLTPVNRSLDGIRADHPRK